MNARSAAARSPVSICLLRSECRAFTMTLKLERDEELFGVPVFWLYPDGELVTLASGLLQCLSQRGHSVSSSPSRVPAETPQVWRPTLSKRRKLAGSGG